MQDENAAIRHCDRHFVVAISILVGVVAGFVTFSILFMVTVSKEDVLGPFVISVLLGLFVLTIVPFVYQFLGRICAIEIDKTRERTFGDSITRLTKSEVVRLSTTSLFFYRSKTLWYFRNSVFR
ncbi:MAG TPA: hypothetical protein VFS76_05340 [Pyrinomonadaceae bacterium]|nr:hypothetical protein [Pyrinomonadaceae bacterium]